MSSPAHDRTSLRSRSVRLRSFFLFLVRAHYRAPAPWKRPNSIGASSKLCASSLEASHPNICSLRDHNRAPAHWRGPTPICVFASSYSCTSSPEASDFSAFCKLIIVRQPAGSVSLQYTVLRARYHAPAQWKPPTPLDVLRARLSLQARDRIVRSMDSSHTNVCLYTSSRSYITSFEASVQAHKRAPAHCIHPTSKHAVAQS